MSQIEMTPQSVIIRGNRFFLGFSIVGFVMAAFGIAQTVELLSDFRDGFSGVDVFGTAFMLVWTGIAVTFGVFGLRQMRGTVVIDDTGVTCRRLFLKTFYRWGEIADWGISYGGQSNANGVSLGTYELYFSKTPQLNKDYSSKKLRGPMIRCYILGGEAADVIGKVLPFCMLRTFVQPFVSDSLTR